MQKIIINCAHCGAACERNIMHIKRSAVCFKCKKERATKYANIYNKTYYENINNIMKKKYTITLTNNAGEDYTKTFVAILHKQEDGTYAVESFESGFSNSYEQEQFMQAVTDDVSPANSVSVFKWI